MAIASSSRDRPAVASAPANEQVLRLFVEHCPAAVAMLDRDLRYLLVSRRWLDDYRLPPQEVIGRGHYELFPDMPERWKEVHRRCLAGAVESSAADPFPRADGSTDWVRWEVRPWQTGGGLVGGLIIITEVITEHVRAERAVRERETHMQLALDAAGAGVWRIDLAAGRFTYDGRMRQIFGRPPEEPGGSLEQVFAAIHPDDLARVRETTDAALAAHQGYDVVHRIVRPDGGTRWISSRGRGQYGDDGVPTHIHGVTLDVTDRVQVEAELRDSHARLRNIFEQASDGIYVISAGNRYVDANRRGCELLGYTREELLALGVADVLAPAEVARLAIEPPRMMAGVPHLAEWEHVRKDGTTFPGEVSAQRLDDKTYIAIVRDLTERRRAEAVVRESSLRLKAIVHAAKVGLWDWDLVTNQVWFSPEWKQQIGYEDHEIGNDFAEWQSRVHPDDLDAALGRVRDYLARPWPDFRTEFRFRHRDGSWRWILAQGQLERDAHGKPVRMLGSHLDITARKAAEAALRTLTTELEQRVAARTAELIAANADLESFSYSVSHDLRAPLRAVENFATILAEEYGPKLDDEARRLIGVVRGGATRMTRLIDDLLRFSRAGRQALELRSVDMAAMASGVFAELSAGAGARRVELKLAGLPPAQADAPAIRQVWANLLANAIKYTRGRDPAVIEVAGAVQDGEVRYTVRDNGAGFDARYADKLFGVFQRLHTTEQFEGSGIGLAIVKRILARHGGRAWAEGSPGQGAAFHFALPQVVAKTPGSTPS